jgi:hypothetical protein
MPRSRCVSKQSFCKVVLSQSSPVAKLSCRQAVLSQRSLVAKQSCRKAVLSQSSLFAKHANRCCGEAGCREAHSGGNDRFCARLKTDISAFSPGLQGHLRSCLTILDSSRRPLSKNVRHDLVRPQRPELEADMSVFNLAQKRSFPPL